MTGPNPRNQPKMDARFFFFFFPFFFFFFFFFSRGRWASEISLMLPCWSLVGTCEKTPTERVAFSKTKSLFLPSSHPKPVPPSHPPRKLSGALPWRRRFQQLRHLLRPRHLLHLRPRRKASPFGVARFWLELGAPTKWWSALGFALNQAPTRAASKNEDLFGLAERGTKRQPAGPPRSVTLCHGQLALGF